MKYRKLDPSGDMVFGMNANGFYTDTDAVGQAIYTSLKLLLGEWWEDTSIGLPLFQSILDIPGTPDHLHAVDMLVQENVLSVQGVQQIQSFSSSFANRIYTIDEMTVQSQFGDISVQGVTFSP